MKTTSLLLSLLLPLVFVVACTKPDGKNSRQVECHDGELKTVGIIGGKTVSSESLVAKGTVFILHTSYDLKEDKEKMMACTGSLIDENIVLTAAHCVPSNEDQARLRVAFSVDPICTIEADGKGALRRVEKVVVHPKYNAMTEDSDYDLALVRFSGVAPSGHVPFRLVKKSIELTPSSQIYVAGYGRTTEANVEDPSSPVLKIAQVQVVENAEVSSKNTSDTHASVLYFDQRKGQGACQGDSGGPTLLKQGNEIFLIGVISAGDTLTASEMTKENVSCKVGLRTASVGGQKEWIHTTYKKLINSNSKGHQFSLTE